jgi:hypothetical protein
MSWASTASGVQRQLPSVNGWGQAGALSLLPRLTMGRVRRRLGRRGFACGGARPAASRGKRVHWRGREPQGAVEPRGRAGNMRKRREAAERAEAQMHAEVRRSERIKSDACASASPPSPCFLYSAHCPALHVQQSAYGGLRRRGRLTGGALPGGHCCGETPRERKHAVFDDAGVARRGVGRPQGGWVPRLSQPLARMAGCQQPPQQVGSVSRHGPPRVVRRCEGWAAAPRWRWRGRCCSMSRLLGMKLLLASDLKSRKLQ